jgi:multisubunit Na+/H+ antiporter MnhG subunit
MEEHMKRKHKPVSVDLGTFLLVIAVLGVVVITVGLLVTLELQMIYTLALILVAGGVGALIIAAASLPIRALKEDHGPHEREIIRERHTIEKDGRRDPRIIMPDRGRTGGAFFPEVIRGALNAGRRERQLTYYDPEESEDGVIHPEDDREWRGQIKG